MYGARVSTYLYKFGGRMCVCTVIILGVRTLTVHYWCTLYFNGKRVFARYHLFYSRYCTLCGIGVDFRRLILRRLIFDL